MTNGIENFALNNLFNKIPGLNRKYFIKTVLKEFGYNKRCSPTTCEDYCDEEVENKCMGYFKCEPDYPELHDCLVDGDYRFTPDAYKIIKENDSIQCYEVEDTHKISKQKLTKYIMVWFFLDCENIDLELYVVDRYGNNINKIDLEDAYYWLLKELGSAKKKYKVSGEGDNQ